MHSAIHLQARSLSENRAFCVSVVPAEESFLYELLHYYEMKDTMAGDVLLQVLLQLLNILVNIYLHADWDNSFYTEFFFF